MRPLGLIIAMIICGLTTIVQQPNVRGDTGRASTDSSHSARFETVDVFIDSHGAPLAAYQFNLNAGSATIVSIEGGESTAFKAAPFYDPKAVQQSHAIIAAFSLNPNLPKTKTRIARVHIFNSAGVKIDYAATLDVAAGSDATAIQAAISLVNGGSK